MEEEIKPEKELKPLKFKLEFEASATYIEGLKQTQFYSVEDKEESIRRWLYDMIRNACYPYLGNWVEVRRIDE